LTQNREADVNKNEWTVPYNDRWREFHFPCRCGTQMSLEINPKRETVNRGVCANCPLVWEISVSGCEYASSDCVITIQVATDPDEEYYTDDGGDDG